VVRLRHWVGDTVLSVPMLRRLEAAGYALRLHGRRWAGPLLAGCGWPVAAEPATRGERVALLRAERAAARVADRGFDRRLNALCLPYSFGSALEFRLAGLRALGHAWEGRRFLLARALPRPAGRHELLVYWDLADALLGEAAPPPARIALPVAPAHRAAALALRERHAVRPGYVVICPFAGGSYDGTPKTWPGFAAFAAGPLRDLGRAVVICPGPGAEAEIARRDFASGAVVLEGVDLGVYAALLEGAAAMVSNDTGPGHLAAAVGCPLVSVLGPTVPAQWGAWGPGVRVVQRAAGWPEPAEVTAALEAALA
jgi:heptosyltransferase-2